MVEPALRSWAPALSRSFKMPVRKNTPITETGRRYLGTKSLYVLPHLPGFCGSAFFKKTIETIGEPGHRAAMGRTATARGVQPGP
jgi:hypothetical protein